MGQKNLPNARRLVDEFRAAEWKRSPRTDAEGQSEFRYQREEWELHLAP